MLGRFNGEKIVTQLLRQISHREIRLGEFYYWDLLYIYEQIKMGLKQAHEICGRIDSAAISTWGIDYGLLNREGLLLANPLCYRNSLGSEGLAALSAAEQKEMFFATGIQCDKINSVYQFLGYKARFPYLWSSVQTALLMPDLLLYFLTGELGTEATIVSTTQLYDVQSQKYAYDLFDRFGLPRDLLPGLVRHGESRGLLQREIAAALGINRCPFVSVPSHDTAAAVTAVSPGQPQQPFLFISSGTWSLIGTERENPLVNEEVYASGFSNEAGVLDTITLLKNSAGLFIAQRLKAECPQFAGDKDWGRIIAAIAGIDEELPLIDPNDEAFFNPVSMKEAITGAVRDSGYGKPLDDAKLFRIVYESLAQSYKEAIARIEDITATGYDRIHIIGGGSRNVLLNELTAQYSGKTVIAGPDEATSLGNLGSQLLFEGRAKSLAEVRAVLGQSYQSAVFTGEDKRK